MFRRLFSNAGFPGPAVDVSEWLREGSGRKELHDPVPGSKLPGGAQGSGSPPVNVSGRQRKGESHCHHRDCEEEEEEWGEEKQPFLTTAEF